MKKILILVAIGLMMVSCTENTRTKNFGGTSTLTLPKGMKLLNVTWKETDLWYLVRPMSPTDSAEVYYFREESAFGLLEGEYIIHEVK